MMTDVREGRRIEAMRSGAGIYGEAKVYALHCG